MAASGKAVVRDSGLRGILASGLAAIFDASDECADCCDGEASPCNSGLPALAVTIEWDDTPGSTPTGVNYSSGPPSTIDAFYDVDADATLQWTKGETKQLCPAYYWYGGQYISTATTLGGTTTASGWTGIKTTNTINGETWRPDSQATTAAMWGLDGVPSGLNDLHSFVFAADRKRGFSPFYEKSLTEIAKGPTSASAGVMAWGALQVFTSGKSFTAPMATLTAHAYLTGTPSYRGGLETSSGGTAYPNVPGFTYSWSANLFTQFSGYMHTANGLEITWEKGDGPWP